MQHLPPVNRVTGMTRRSVLSPFLAGPDPISPRSGVLSARRGRASRGSIPRGERRDRRGSGSGIDRSPGVGGRAIVGGTRVGALADSNLVAQPR